MRRPRASPRLRPRGHAARLFHLPRNLIRLNILRLSALIARSVPSLHSSVLAIAKVALVIDQVAEPIASACLSGDPQMTVDDLCSTAMTLVQREGWCIDTRPSGHVTASVSLQPFRVRGRVALRAPSADAQRRLEPTTQFDSLLAHAVGILDQAYVERGLRALPTEEVGRALDTGMLRPEILATALLWTSSRIQLVLSPRWLIRAVLDDDTRCPTDDALDRGPSPITCFVLPSQEADRIATTGLSTRFTTDFCLRDALLAQVTHGSRCPALPEGVSAMLVHTAAAAACGVRFEMVAEGYFRFQHVPDVMPRRFRPRSAPARDRGVRICWAWHEAATLPSD